MGCRRSGRHGTGGRAPIRWPRCGTRRWCRMLRGRTGADGGDGARGAAAPPSRAVRRRGAAHAAAAHPPLAAPSTARSARCTSPRSTRRAGWGCRTSPWPTSSASASPALAFAHRLYQFALAYCGWRHARVVLGGESFQALAAGLQDALWRLGGVPAGASHRQPVGGVQQPGRARGTDPPLRGAVRALRHARDAQQPRREPRERLDRGAPGQLKRALDQALLLRGSREFADLPAYGQFVAETVRRLNARCAEAWEVERACLQAAAGPAHGRLRGG